MAAYLHRRSPSNSLLQVDDRQGHKATYNTPYEILHAYGMPYHSSEGNKISYKPHYTIYGDWAAMRANSYQSHSERASPERSRSSAAWR